MARKSLGYVELEWTCPNCNTKNPGFQKTCVSCGMPQPEDVQFQQKAQETLIKDEEKLVQIKAGPDLHCYYCGSRNPATAATCSQCGADLSEGARRKAGQTLGAHRDKPAEKIGCPACGTPNEADAPKCIQCGASLSRPGTKPAEPASQPARPQARSKSAGRSGSLKWRIGAIVAVIAICSCIATFFILSDRTEDSTGTVSGVAWERSVQIEGLVPVSYEDWHDEIPAESVVGTCTQKVRRTQDEPAPNSREICGTPYTIDTGTGAGEVVQDCRYEVSERYCEYTVDEWKVVDTAIANGSNYSPSWPDTPLGAGKRAGEQAETYLITFNTDNGQYTYETSDENLFQQAQIGSQWTLKINTFDVVMDIEPR